MTDNLWMDTCPEKRDIRWIEPYKSPKNLSKYRDFTH
jgi:hypothetical protein